MDRNEYLWIVVVLTSIVIILSAKLLWQTQEYSADCRLAVDPSCSYSILKNLCSCADGYHNMTIRLIVFQNKIIKQPQYELNLTEILNS